MPTVDLTGRNILSIQADPAYKNTIEFGGVHYPGVNRPGPVKVTMVNRGAHVRTLLEAFQKATPVLLKMQGFAVKAFVSELRPRGSVDGVGEVDIVFKPTGRPVQHRGFLQSAWDSMANDMRRQAEGRIPRDTGALRSSIRGKSFTHSIIDEISKAVGVPAHILTAEPPLHPYCRSLLVGLDIESTATKKERPVKIRNRFYVASPNVTTDKEQGQDNVAGKVMLENDPKRVGSLGKWTRKNLNDALAHAELMLDADPKLDHVAVVRIVRMVRRKKAPVVVEVIK